MDELRVLKHLQAVEGYLALGMEDEALVEVDAALAEDANCASALQAKAFILLSQKQFADAEQWFEKLLAVKPKSIEGWIHLAYCRRRTTSLPAAVEALQRALDIDATHTLANYNMACYCALEGRHADALRLLQKAIETDPNYRRMAREECDFDSMRDLPSFQSLIAQS